MLEEIVRDIEQEVMDTITFHQLRRIELRRLPNLRSFYGNTKRMSTTGCNTSTLAQALFNDKVAFPALEKLEIEELGSLTAIWDDQLQSVLQLQKLNITDCEMMEEIISEDQEVMDTVSFHRLKTMKLERLPNLRSFVNVNMKKTSTTRCNTFTRQALFNHKVAFPVLEKLEIEELGSLTAIWDDQLQSLLVRETEDSFRRLIYMEVFKCEKLVNVIPSNMLPRLQNLEKLIVSQCDSVLYEVEVVGIVEKRYPTSTTPTINVLPRLQEMCLWNLPSLVMCIRLNRLCTYSNLTDLYLSNRDSLENVFSLSTAKYLVHLQILKVAYCEKMEEIVAVERGQLREEDVMHDDDIIFFPQLKVLELENLPNLKSICCCTRGSKKQDEETLEQKNISRVEALFNHKVRFPTLEKLELKELKSLTAIWDNQLYLGSRAQDSFSQLRLVAVQSCEKLVNVIPLNAIPMLQNLESLKVVRCDSVISGFEVAAVEGGSHEILMFPQLKKLKLEMLPKLSSLCCSRRREEERVAIEGGSDEILMFPQLKKLELEMLPKLSSLCCSRRRGEERVAEESNIGQPQALFNHKVRLTALEELKINDLESLTTIWDNELFLDVTREGSFQRLRNINVGKCQKLVNVLEVSTLSGVEAIATEECSDKIVVFPRLKTMRLALLPNLKSFCSSRRGGEDRKLEENNIPQQQLFNHKVAFPALEKLEIEELGSLTAIWDDQLQSLLVKEAEDSFRRLMYMKVFKCEKLVKVIPSNMLPMLHNLEELEVSQCDSVLYEVEVVGTVEKGYPTATTPTIIVLPRLQEMNLWKLPSLVMYIRLNILCSYSNLTDLHLSNRDSLENAFSPSTAKYLVHLQKLTVGYCEKMEEIVAVERGQLREEDEIIVFFQLKDLELLNLPNLKSICCCNDRSNKQEEETVDQNISRVEALFNHKVRFPALENLNIKKLKSLTAIWDNQLFLESGAQDSFQQLRLVTVERCKKLVNVIKNEEQGEEDSTDEIVFSQLEKLILLNLAKLTSFCGANNAACKFPSLKEFVLDECPELQTFASGGICTPPDVVVYDDRSPRCVSELNKYVEQQYIEKGKGLQTADEGTST